MDEINKSILEKKEVGESCYLNKNCWLVRNLNYSPYKRCQYCEFKFQKCMFMQYQIISFVLILFSFSIFFLVEKKLSVVAIITIFSFVIIYGYFFNTSTERIIKSNFFLKKARKILKALTGNLENRVREQTHDIREKNKNLEAQAHQLEKDKKKLIELDRMKDEFLQMATHELNTPITVIQGKLSMAIDENMCDLDRKQKEFLKPILLDTIRLAGLSKDILNVTRIDQKRLKIELVETDFDALISTIVSGFDIKAKERGNSIAYIKLNKEPIRLTLDQSKIGEVISNLIGNANKFTENGKIAVTTKVKDNNVIVSVADTGVGIEKEDQKHLFEKFYQAGRFDPDCPQEQQGTGLGLYISKNIIELHDGKIWLESDKGKGSTFNFSLPLR